MSERLVSRTLTNGNLRKVVMQFHEAVKLEKVPATVTRSQFMPYFLLQIQLLSHEFKIPTKVEVWVLPATALPSSEDGGSVPWQHLGFVR